MTDVALELEMDKDWIARLHAGDPGVFERLHALYAMELSAFLAARSPRRLSADDLGQATWLKIWDKRKDFQGGSFRAWMYRIARNLLIDNCRRKYPETLSEDIDPVAIAVSEENEWIDALRACLEQIEGTFVEVIRGKTQGMTTEQLAEKFQINSKTVATRIHRGKQLLHDCVMRKMQ